MKVLSSFQNSAAKHYCILSNQWIHIWLFWWDELDQGVWVGRESF